MPARFCEKLDIAKIKACHLESLKNGEAISFQATEQSRCGEPYLGASCGICGLKETGDFDGAKQPAYRIKKHILSTLFEWMCALGCIPPTSFLDLIDLLSLQVC